MDETLGHKRLSKLLDPVIHDVALSTSARVMFVELALQGNRVQIGERVLAALVGLNRETVRGALAELAKRGHIEIHGTGLARRTYELTGWVRREVVRRSARNRGSVVV